MNKFLIVLSLLTIFGRNVFSQNIADVNPLTGAANINIPIYTLTNGQVSLPVNLTYMSGIKPLDVEGTGGMGWQVNAGGQISRQVRGIPDDVTKDNAGNSMLGWMSGVNTAANAIGGFAIQNDGGVTCSNETSDNAYISTNFPFNYDTEPDMFSVSAPGLSCQLVYNRATGKFVPIAYSDILISFVTDPTTGLITSFTIINNKGIRYVFSACEVVKQTTSGGTPTYFTTQYKQYQHGINYTDSWSLTSMTDNIGNAIVLTYDNGSSYTRSSTNPLSLFLPGTTTPTLQYNIQQTVTTPTVQHIRSNNSNATNQYLSFLWDRGSTGQGFVTNISGMGREFEFTYSQVYYANSYYTRFFLRNFTDYGCATPVNYQFAYGGETSTSGNFTTLLPDSAAVKVDYWGYAAFNSNSSLQPKVWVNPSNNVYQRYAIYLPATGGGSYSYSTTNGSNRSAELTNFNVGNLVSISYTGGASTTITYEPNSYIDVPSNQIAYGGGVRVSKITDYDGVDASKNLIHNYSYNNPSTGLTSGKPTTLPAFAFTIPYSGAATGAALWNNNTVLSDYDLSNEDHSILYSYFKVSQTGAGSTLYQYYVPAMNWDVNAAPVCSGCATDWTPTVNNIARNNCTTAYGPISNGIYTYPFIPNPNYDLERGVLQKVMTFNDAGTEVSEINYTYQRSFNPSVMTAFKYEDNPGGGLSAKAYNKYNIYFNTSELMSTVVKKIFDSSTLSQAQSSTINYVYGSPYHKLLTQQSVTNSDNSTVITNTKYIKDYTAAAGSNPNVNALYYLQQQNLNAPVETWQQVIRNGVTKTVGANLKLFKTFVLGSNNFYLPSQQLRFIQPDGANSFTPFTVNGQVSSYDPQYQPTANFDTYDITGFQQSVDDGNKNVRTTVLDHSTNGATATFSNATYGEIAFSDFDTDQASPPSCSFTISGSGSFTPNGSHTGNAYGFGAAQTLSNTITAKNAKVSNYIFSVWINAANAGSLNFTLTGGNSSTYTKSFTAGGWTYYEWKLPVSNMSSSFTISLTSNQAISIDDILFYPDIARVNTASYDPQTAYLVAETNTNGISTYYKKDPWGRLLFQFDQDRNIVKKRSYFTADAITAGLVSPAVSQGPVTVLVPATFTAAPTPCATGVTYTWNFGDGTPAITALNGNIQSHAYSNIGNYTVTVTASHPTFGTNSSTQTITVKPPPLTPQVCQSGVINWDNCTNKASRVVTCGSNPSDNGTSYFTVTSVGGSGYGALSYLWQISYNLGVDWIGAGGDSQLVMDCGPESKSYTVRCIVTSTSGQSGTSATMGFSAPVCNSGGGKG